jgi:hypothetical protein
LQWHAVGRTHFQDTCVSLSLEAGLVTLADLALHDSVLNACRQDGRRARSASRFWAVMVSRAGQGAVKVQCVPADCPLMSLSNDQPGSNVYMGEMQRHFTPHKCHVTFARFRTAMLAFLAR